MSTTTNNEKKNSHVNSSLKYTVGSENAIPKRVVNKNINFIFVGRLYGNA